MIAPFSYYLKRLAMRFVTDFFTLFLLALVVTVLIAIAYFFYFNYSKHPYRLPFSRPSLTPGRPIVRVRKTLRHKHPIHVTDKRFTGTSHEVFIKRQEEKRKKRKEALKSFEK